VKRSSRAWAAMFCTALNFVSTSSVTFPDAAMKLEGSRVPADADSKTVLPTILLRLFRDVLLFNLFTNSLTEFTGEKRQRYVLKARLKAIVLLARSEQYIKILLKATGFVSFQIR